MTIICSMWFHVQKLTEPKGLSAIKVLEFGMNYPITCDVKTMSTFKSGLKTYYFKVAHMDWTLILMNIFHRQFLYYYADFRHALIF